MTPERQRGLRPAILGFILTTIILVGLLTTQFALKYGPDIFGNNIDTSAICKMLFLAAMGTVQLALPICVMVMTTVYYRNRSKKDSTNISFKSTLFISTTFALLSFVWVAFIHPVIELHEVRLLYDIRSKEVNQSLANTSLLFFKKAALTCNYTELNETVDSIYKYTLNKKAEFIGNMKQYELQPEALIVYKASIAQDVEYANDNIRKLKVKKAQMLSFPVLIFLLFYTGAFLGMLNRNSRLSMFLLGMFLTVLPGIYYLSLRFEKLAKEGVLTPFQSQLFFIAIVGGLTLCLFFYSQHRLSTTDSQM